MRKTTHIRADPIFADELEIIKTERIKEGKDSLKTKKSDRRITAAIRRHNLWGKIKKDITIADLRDDVRGSMFDLVVWMVLALVVIVVLAGLLYGFNFFTNTITGVTIENDLFNFTDIVEDTVVPTNAAFGNLRILSVAIIFGMILMILVSYFLIKAHPAFWIFYVLLIIAFVVVAVIISNQYETLLTGNPLSDTLRGFTGGTFIMLYLPVWVIVIGMIGGIILFAGIQRDEGAGGGIV